MVSGQIGRICFFRILDSEDLAEAIKKKAEDAGVKAGVFSLIGTLENCVIGYYKEGKYKQIRLNGPLEISSCMGNIAANEKGEVMVHAHVVVSNEYAESFGGHLMNGSQVGATAELVIIEALDVNLIRAFDEKTKLNLLRLS